MIKKNTSKTILIIDDDDDSRYLLKYHFKDMNYIIIEANNGKKGIELALKYIPDLILIDIMMPVMDGFSAIKIIRNNNSLQSIPIIVLTAGLDKNEEKKYTEIGCNECIEKPINLKKLSKLISKYTNPQ